MAHIDKNADFSIRLLKKIVFYGYGGVPSIRSGSVLDVKIYLTEIDSIRVCGVRFA